MLYRKLQVKFDVSSTYSYRDYRVHTDKKGLIDSSKQEYTLYEFATPSAEC